MGTCKQDWLETGMRFLGEFGISGLTIERMTDHLGVTKGSFYHHFKNMRDFEEQLISFWRDQYLSTSGSMPEDPVESLDLLDAIMKDAFSSVTEPEVALRNWAQRDELAYSCVEQVDAARREFIFNIFQKLVNDESRARLMTDILFAILIGSITVLPRIPSDRVLEMYREFKRLYGFEK